MKTITLQMSEHEAAIVRSALKSWQAEQHFNLILAAEIEGLLARMEVEER